eukprot:TRINITY_DN11872_c0_g1_i1.p1 TRINITY_DN11872_c0_g1~~TRINITY_DN11872_c0_g1_i1.p1  ORF type:complete len:323 (-),score=83.70 TRINITY_DN11872_c0_g1_i1:456-1424(-)
MKNSPTKFISFTNSSVQVWGTDHNLQHNFNHHKSSKITSLSFSHDNKKIISASEDGSIAISKLDGTLETSLKSETEIYSITLGGENYLGCASKEGVIEIFDIKQKKWLKRFNDTDNKTSRFNSICFNDVGSHIIASNDTSSYISIFNTNNSTLSYLSSNSNVNNTNFVGAPINQITFSPLRSSILGGVSEKGTLLIWDINKTSPQENNRKIGGSLIQSYEEKHTAPSTSLSFSPTNEKQVVTVGLDKKLNLYDLGAKRVTTNILQHPLSYVSFSGDSKYIYTSTLSGSIFIYDVRSIKKPFKTIDHVKTPYRRGRREWNCWC